MGKQASVVYGNIENGQAERRTTPVRNGSRMTARGLPVNARSRGRLGLRLGLLYSHKVTARSARCGARPGLLGQRATLGHTLSVQGQARA